MSDIMNTAMLTDWSGIASRALAASRLRASRRPLVVDEPMCATVFRPKSEHGWRSPASIGNRAGSPAAGYRSVDHYKGDGERTADEYATVIELLPDGTWRQVDRDGQPVAS